MAEPVEPRGNNAAGIVSDVRRPRLLLRALCLFVALPFGAVAGLAVAGALLDGSANAATAPPAAPLGGVGDPGRSAPAATEAPVAVTSGAAAGKAR